MNSENGAHSEWGRALGWGPHPYPVDQSGNLYASLDPRAFGIMLKRGSCRQ